MFKQNCRNRDDVMQFLCSVLILTLNQSKSVLMHCQINKSRKIAWLAHSLLPFPCPSSLPACWLHPWSVLPGRANTKQPIVRLCSAHKRIGICAQTNTPQVDVLQPKRRNHKHWSGSIPGRELEVWFGRDPRPVVGANEQWQLP